LADDLHLRAERQFPGCFSRIKAGDNMEIILGPWTAEKTIQEVESTPLTLAMGDEAWKIVKRLPDFTPKKRTGDGREAGYAISGHLTTFAKSGRSKQVAAQFSITLDGQLSNVAIMHARATADGSATAEDALRSITETKVKSLLQIVKAGRVGKLGHAQ